MRPHIIANSNINNGKSKYLLLCKFFLLCIENKNNQILHNLKVNLYSILYLLHLSDEIDFNVGKSSIQQIIYIDSTISNTENGIAVRDIILITD